MLQCCICRRLSFVTLCIVAKRCVLEQKLLLTKVVWEIYWYQNELPWPLFRGRIKIMSTIALHSTLNIAETVSYRGLVPKGPPIGNDIWAIKWSRDRWRHESRRSATLATAWLLLHFQAFHIMIMYTVTSVSQTRSHALARIADRTASQQTLVPN